jgi:hypothetical protein
MKCSICSKELATSSERIPTGWKRRPDGIYCTDCWRARYVLRAVTIPVVGPVGNEWPEFREAMRQGWGRATEASNWMLSELFTRDVRRTPDMDKLPTMPKIYLYPEARKLFPELPSQTLASMENAIKSKYRKTRYKLLWTNEVSLPNYCYPSPFVVPNQGWSAIYGPENVPLVQFRLAGNRWTLRLRGGHQYRRPLKSFAQIVSGLAVSGELAIYRQRANGNDHRNGMSDRGASGQHAHYRVMCKMAAWLPRDVDPLPREGVLFVTTADDALLVALNAKNERLWTINADHVLRWSAENRRRNQRRSEDRKMEVRGAGHMDSSGERHSLKYRRRMKTACDQFAAQVVNYAKRWKFAAVRAIAADSEYAPDFTWFALWQAIEQRCNHHGIEFEKESPNGKGRETEVIGTGA